MYLTGRINLVSSLAAGAVDDAGIGLNPAGIYGAFSRMTVRAQRPLLPLVATQGVE